MIVIRWEAGSSRDGKRFSKRATSYVVHKGGFIIRTRLRGESFFAELLSQPRWRHHRPSDRQPLPLAHKKCEPYWYRVRWSGLESPTFEVSWPFGVAALKVRRNAKHLAVSSLHAPADLRFTASAPKPPRSAGHQPPRTLRNR